MSAADGAFRRSGSARWRRHFESTRDHATSSIDNILQCSSKVLLHSRARVLPTLSGVRTGETGRGSSAASSDVATQVRLRATLAGYGSSKKPPVSASTSSSSVPNTGPLRLLATQTTTADDSKLLTRFDGRPDDYIPPKLTKSSGLAGGRVSRVTSQMERQLECVTVVTNFQKGDDFEPRKISIPEYLTRPPAAQLGFEAGELADSFTSEKGEVEEAMNSLRKKDRSREKKRTWPPKEEVPTLIHHNPSRNPLSEFAKLKDPVENREFKDGWARGSVFPSLGAGLKYSENSGLNPTDPRNLISTWFKKKRAAAPAAGAQSNEGAPGVGAGGGGAASGQPEIPSFLSLLQDLSLQPMTFNKERKTQHDKNINPQVVPLRGGVVHVSEETPRPPKLSIIKQAHMQAIAKEVELDDALPPPAPARKQKSEKEMGVQTTPPTAAPAVRPKVEPKAKATASPTSALKQSKSLKKGIRFLSADRSSSSSSSDSSTEASPRLSSSKLRTGSLRQATSPGVAEGEGEGGEGSSDAPGVRAGEGGQLFKNGGKKRDKRKSRIAKQIQEEMEKERRMQEKVMQEEAAAQMRRRYSAYMNVVCGFPRRRLPRLDKDGASSSDAGDDYSELHRSDDDQVQEEEEIAAMMNPPHVQQLCNYPPWTYFPCPPAFSFAGSSGEGRMPSVPQPAEAGVPHVDAVPTLVKSTAAEGRQSKGGKRQLGEGGSPATTTSDEEEEDAMSHLVNEALSFFVPGFENLFINPALAAEEGERHGEGGAASSSSGVDGSSAESRLPYFLSPTGGGGGAQGSGGGFLTAIPMLHALPQPDNVWKEVAEEAGEEAREKAMREWARQYEEAWRSYRMQLGQQQRRQEDFVERSQRRERTRAPWSEEDVKAKQEEIMKEIQEEHREFNETKEVLENAIQNNPFSHGGDGPMGTCRGGRRAWVRFDRAARTAETRKNYASQDYRMLPDEDDEFDKICPPALPRARTSSGAVGIRGGRRHRGREGRPRGRDRGGAPTPATTIRDVNLQLDIRDVPRASDKDYPELAETDEDDVTGPMERAEFQVRRNNEVDRMLGDLLPLYEGKLPRGANHQFFLQARKRSVGSKKEQQPAKGQALVETKKKSSPTGASSPVTMKKAKEPPSPTKEGKPPSTPSGTSSSSAGTATARPSGADDAGDVETVKLACPVQKWVRIEQKIRGSEAAVEVERTSGRILSEGQGTHLPDVVEFFGQRATRFHESPKHSAVRPPKNKGGLQVADEDGARALVRSRDTSRSFFLSTERDFSLREKALNGGDAAKTPAAVSSEHPSTDFSLVSSQQACFVGLLGARSQSRSPSPLADFLGGAGGKMDVVELQQHASFDTNGKRANRALPQSEQGRGQRTLFDNRHAQPEDISPAAGDISGATKKKASFPSEGEDTSIEMVGPSLPTFGRMEGQDTAEKMRDESTGESACGVKGKDYRHSKEGHEEGPCLVLSLRAAQSDKWNRSTGAEDTSPAERRLPTFGYGLEDGSEEEGGEDVMESTSCSLADSEGGAKTLVACDLQKMLRRKEWQWDRERAALQCREEGCRRERPPARPERRESASKVEKEDGWTPLVWSRSRGGQHLRRRSFETTSGGTWLGSSNSERTRRRSLTTVPSYAPSPLDGAGLVGGNGRHSKQQQQQSPRLGGDSSKYLLHSRRHEGEFDESCVHAAGRDSVRSREVRVIKSAFDATFQSCDPHTSTTTTGGSRPTTASTASLSDSSASSTGRGRSSSACSTSSDCEFDAEDLGVRGQRVVRRVREADISTERRKAATESSSYAEEAEELSPSCRDRAVSPIFRRDSEREVLEERCRRFDSQERSGSSSGDLDDSFCRERVLSENRPTDIRSEDDFHLGSPCLNSSRRGSHHPPPSVSGVRLLGQSRQYNPRTSPLPDGHAARRSFWETEEGTRFTGITTDSSEFHHRYLLYKRRPHLRTLFSAPLSSPTPSPRPSSFPWDDEVIPTCRAAAAKGAVGPAAVREGERASTDQSTEGASASCDNKRPGQEKPRRIPLNEEEGHGSPRRDGVPAGHGEGDKNETLRGATLSIEKTERNSSHTLNEVNVTSDPAETISTASAEHTDGGRESCGVSAEQPRQPPRQPFLRRGCGIGGGRYDRLQNSQAGTASSSRGRSIVQDTSSSLRGRSLNVSRDSSEHTTRDNSELASLRRRSRTVSRNGFASQERYSGPGSSSRAVSSVENDSTFSTPRCVSPYPSSMSRGRDEKNPGDRALGMNTFSQVSAPSLLSTPHSDAGGHCKDLVFSPISVTSSSLGSSTSAALARYKDGEFLLSDSLLGIGMFPGRSSLSKSNQPRSWDEVPCLPPRADTDEEEDGKKLERKPFLKKGSGKLAGDVVHRGSGKDSSFRYNRRGAEGSRGASTSGARRCETSKEHPRDRTAHTGEQATCHGLSKDVGCTRAREVSPRPKRTWKARFAPKEDRSTGASRGQSRGRSAEDKPSDSGVRVGRQMEPKGARRPRYAECVDLSGYFERPKVHLDVPQHIREKITLGL